MPRFVLLYHECPPGCERPSHWDLMLEVENALRTWALPCLPQDWKAARERTAALFPACAVASDESSLIVTRLADHRTDYLHAEGPLTGNRGEVRRIDAGTYETVSEDSRSWRVMLCGDLIKSEIALRDSSLTL
jgi:hypothetical protein